MSRIKKEILHKKFLESINQYVNDHSNINEVPLEIDFSRPLPSKIRLYIYSATCPTGGRPSGECKIQLIAPDQQRGETESFDTSGGRIVLVVGYHERTNVFILWDADLYPEFSYSRNLQVKTKTIYKAVAGDIGEQLRHLRTISAKEVVLTALHENLDKAIQRRMELKYERLVRS